jgi:hypothetical protein
MPYGSSSAAGEVGVALTGSRITRAMQPSAARGGTNGPRPLRNCAGAFYIASKNRECLDSFAP